MKKALGRAAWQLCKENGVDDPTKEAAKIMIMDMRDDQNRSAIWEDIDSFTDKVPQTPEEARDLLSDARFHDLHLRCVGVIEWK